MNTIRWSPLFVAGALVLVSAPAFAANPIDNILEKHIEAMGGEDAIDNIKTITREAEAEMTGAFGNMEGTQKEAIVVGEKVFGELDLGVFQETTVWNGEVAWKDNSMQGVSALEGEELETIKAQSEISILATVWREQGAAAFVLLPDETHDGKKWTVLAIAGEAGKYYLDQSSHLLHRITMPFSDPASGEEGTVVVSMEAYETHENVPFPEKVGFDVGPGLITIELDYSKTELNTEIDPSLFEKPE